jgi:hypothetical protein
MGTYKGTVRDLQNIVDQLKDKFKGSDYHLLSKNCNAFAEEFLAQISKKPFPAHVNRLASIGSLFSCLLPQSMLNEAPVEKQQENVSFTSSGSNVNKRSNYNRKNTNGSGNSGVNTAFNGKGNKLGNRL